MANASPTIAPFTWRDAQLFLKTQPDASAAAVPKALLFDMQDQDDRMPSRNEGVASCAHLEALPVLPEAHPAFVGSRHFLFINEMKFRELFSTLYATAAVQPGGEPDLRLLRVGVDADGGVEPLAMLCRVLERRMLKSGMAMYVIEAEQAVRVHALNQRPGVAFLHGYWEPHVMEDPLASCAENEQLCTAVFGDLKAYLRLARLHAEELGRAMGVEPTDSRSALSLSPQLLATRPGPAVLARETPQQTAERHARFSCALANLIKSSPATMQTLLEASTAERLKGLQRMVRAAEAQISQELSSGRRYESGGSVVGADVRLVEKRRADPEDGDEDLLPSPDHRELSLDQVQLELGDDEVLPLSDGEDRWDDSDDGWGANSMQ